MRKQPTSTTIKKLFALSGNKCAFPKCNENLVDREDIVCEICHIEAAEKGGPRYNDSKTDDERRAFENLILLCRKHSKVIDSKANENKYTVKKLKKMKREHEKKYKHNEYTVSYRIVEKIGADPILIGTKNSSIYNEENNLFQKLFNIKNVLKKNRQPENFIGRKKTFQNFLTFMVKELVNKRGLVIKGGAGSGKTTLAKDAATCILPNVCTILIDLRVCKNIENLHSKVVKAVFDEAILNKKQRLLEECSLGAVFGLSTLKNILFIIDHGELLCNTPDRFKDITTFFSEIPDNCRVIITSQKNIDFIKDINTYYLKLPTTREVVEMLSYWISTKSKWIEELAGLVGNHPFVIRQIGVSCKGSYDKKETLEKQLQSNIRYSIEVNAYFKNLIDELSEDIKFWIYLILLSDENGFIYKEAVPEPILLYLEEQQLILSEDNQENLDIITFHPIIVNAIKQSNSTQMFSLILQKLEQLQVSPLIAYYKFLCHKRLKNNNEAKELILNHWLEWIEVLGPTNSLAIFETEATPQAVLKELDKYQCLRKIACGIARMLRGTREDLSLATELFQELYYSQKNISPYLKLLVLCEYIECIRKKDGTEVALSFIEEKIEEINSGIEYLNKNPSSEATQVYCYGTIYFLWGNFFRAVEDHFQAIKSYDLSLSYFSLREEDFNISIQKTHSYYGIAESHLRVGDFNSALSTVSHLFSSQPVTSHIVRALTNLQRGRAYLLGNKIDEGIKSVEKAINLFRKLNLSHYYARCQLVLAALYLRKKDINISADILNKLKEYSDGYSSRAINIRAKILLNIINTSKIKMSDVEFDTICKHCGLTIAISYKLLQEGDSKEIDELLNKASSIIKLTEDSNKIIVDKTASLTRLKEKAKTSLTWLID
ncbi:MAG: hypothetical protein PHX21_13460 [bacterium]|nr:hypothetical protein [bacterium]